MSEETENCDQLSKAIVMDRRFFSCVGNMVLLPTPLKVFTDTIPEIKAMLRICDKTGIQL